MHMQRRLNERDDPSAEMRRGGRRGIRVWALIAATLPLCNGVLLIIQNAMTSEPFDVAFPPEAYIVVNGAVVATAAAAKIVSLLAANIALLREAGVTGSLATIQPDGADVMADDAMAGDTDTGPVESSPRR